MKNIAQFLLSKNMPKPFFMPLHDGFYDYNYTWPIFLLAIDAVQRTLKYKKEQHVVFTESGGITTEAPPDPYSCMAMQIQSKPDVVFALDFPMKKTRAGIDLTPKTESEKLKTMRWHIQYAKEAVRIKDWFVSEYEHDFEVCPIVQGWDDKSIAWCASEFAALECSFFAGGFYGITLADRADFKRLIVRSQERTILVRDIIGRKSWLHALGVTQTPLLVSLKKYITSFDSTKPIALAGYNRMTLEDGRDVYVGSRFGQKTGGLAYSQFDYDVFETGEKGLSIVNFNNFVKYLYKVLWN